MFVRHKPLLQTMELDPHGVSIDILKPDPTLSPKLQFSRLIKTCPMVAEQFTNKDRDTVKERHCSYLLLDGLAYFAA